MNEIILIEKLISSIKETCILLNDNTKDMNAMELRSYLIGYHDAMNYILDKLDYIKEQEEIED